MGIEEINTNRAKASQRRRDLLVKFVKQQPEQSISETLLAKFFGNAFGIGIQSFRNDLAFILKAGMLEKRTIYVVPPELPPLTNDSFTEGLILPKEKRPESLNLEKIGENIKQDRKVREEQKQEEPSEETEELDLSNIDDTYEE